MITPLGHVNRGNSFLTLTPQHGWGTSFSLFGECPIQALDVTQHQMWVFTSPDFPMEGHTSVLVPKMRSPGLQPAIDTMCKGPGLTAFLSPLNANLVDIHSLLHLLFPTSLWADVSFYPRLVQSSVSLFIKANLAITGLWGWKSLEFTWNRCIVYPVTSLQSYLCYFFNCMVFNYKRIKTRNNTAMSCKEVLIGTF